MKTLVKVLMLLAAVAGVAVWVASRLKFRKFRGELVEMDRRAGDLYDEKFHIDLSEDNDSF